MRGNSFRSFGGDQVAVVGVEGHHEADCFADEVVIDFPSVAPAIDRMRLAFLGDERGAAQPASVHITSAAARHGATVPLEVPLRCTCRECGGRGEMWVDSCRACRGTGVEWLRRHLHVYVPAGVVDGARFRFTVTPRRSIATRIELHVVVDCEK
jgi:hypothetical protein